MGPEQQGGTLGYVLLFCLLLFPSLLPCSAGIAALLAASPLILLAHLRHAVAVDV